MSSFASFTFSRVALVSSVFATPRQFITSTALNVLGDQDTQSTEIETETEVEKSQNDTTKNTSQKAKSPKQVKQAQEAAKTKREETKKKLEEARAAFKTKRETFKTNLTQIRDEKRRSIAKNICNKLVNLNSRYTEHLTNVSSRLSSVLEKLQARDSASACSEIITTAETAISAAESAIASQIGKSYSCSATNDTTVKSDLSEIHKTVKNDLAAVRNQINGARNAIGNVVTCLRQNGSDQEPQPSTTP